MTLNASQKCTVAVAFAPTITGPQTGSLVFTDNAVSSPLYPQAVQLIGNGTVGTPVPTPGGQTPPVPKILPASIDFGTETVGVTSGSENVTVTNHSSIPLVMASPAETITGPFAIPSGATDTCEGVTLGAGASCVVSLAFTPTGSGEVLGSVSFLDNAPSNILTPQTAQLRGFGTFSTPVPTPAPAGQSASATISPASLNLGAVELGNSSATMNVKITSTSATTPLVIDAVTITSTGSDSVAAQFSEADNCTAGPLGDGQSCTVSITFTPAGAGSFQASLVLSDNVPFNISHPQSVSLTASGYSPPAAPTPAPTNSIQL